MHRTSLSAMMVPNRNSVVLRCKTTMWSCLSWTTCSHVCSRTSSCFGACYRSSSPENLATPSRRFVLQSFIFLSRLDESGISSHQPDLNLRQIWWLEHSQHLHFVPSLHHHCANFPWAAFSAVVFQDHFQKWTYHGSHPSPMTSKKITHCIVFNKVVHIIHPSPSMSFLRTPSNERL